MSALLWRHRDWPGCPPFDAMRWWAAPKIVWDLPGEPPLEQRACPGGCRSHISAEALEPVVVRADEPSR